MFVHTFCGRLLQIEAVKFTVYMLSKSKHHTLESKVATLDDFFSQDQYIFIHDAVLESVTCGDTEIKAADLRRKLVKLKTRDQSGLNALDLQFAVSDIFFVRNNKERAR